jgi:hypothetical protein
MWVAVDLYCVLCRGVSYLVDTWARSSVVEQLSYKQQEHRSDKPEGGGSNPPAPTIKEVKNGERFRLFILWSQDRTRRN